MNCVGGKEIAGFETVNVTHLIGLIKSRMAKRVYEEVGFRKLAGNVFRKQRRERP